VKREVGVSTFMEDEKEKIKYIRKTLNGFYKSKKLVIKLK